MSRSDGGAAERRIFRRSGQLDERAALFKTNSLDERQSQTHQTPPPPLLRNPLLRSQSTQHHSSFWNTSSSVRRGSLLSPTDPQSLDSVRGPNASGSRRNASRDSSSHASQNLAVPNPMKREDGALAHVPRSFRSYSSPSATTLSTIRRMSPSMLSATDTAYSYDYLDDGEFRLIILCPKYEDDPEDVVRCEMFTCLLNKSPPYIALSYAWGDVSDTRRILVGRADIAVNVSASLESALRALRDSNNSILVWADALSINQDDTFEKAGQVRLMTQIYQKAKSVALWLGLQSEDSDRGMELIQKVADGAKVPLEITKRTPEPFSEQNVAAVVALFDRQYWHRLWVVQEVFNAQVIHVHCGSSVLPWKAFQTASDVFRGHKDVLERSFHPGYSNSFYQARSGKSYSQVLIHGGPGSLHGIGTRANFKDDDNLPDSAVFRDLLDVISTCRSKLTSDPKDKVFGLLGVLSERVRSEIKVDYSLTVKEVYVDIFRKVIEKTHSLNILCESIHFPVFTNNNNLPSWVPDWSHISPVSPIATIHAFSASRKAEVDINFTGNSKLKIRAIPLGKIKEHGIAVGTLCTVNDYLMAFLQWRACLSHVFEDVEQQRLQSLKRSFCLTLSLEHTPEGYGTPAAWMDVCFHVFANTIRNRLPTLQMDCELEQYIERKEFQMNYNKRRLFLQEHFGSKMMGRCFCITDEKRLGMGTGFMIRGDVAVVPLGCSTPVILRQEGDGYRFVGDVYINGYMDGQAVEECNEGFVDRQIRSYVIH